MLVLEWLISKNIGVVIVLCIIKIIWSAIIVGVRAQARSTQAGRAKALALFKGRLSK